MEYTAIDVIRVPQRFIAVIVSPELPPFAPGSDHMVRVLRPDGSTIEASAVIEYTRSPPLVPALLRFDGLLPADIPATSKLEFLAHAK